MKKIVEVRDNHSLVIVVDFEFVRRGQNLSTKRYDAVDLPDAPPENIKNEIDSCRVCRNCVNGIALHPPDGTDLLCTIHADACRIADEACRFFKNRNEQ